MQICKSQLKLLISQQNIAYNHILPNQPHRVMSLWNQIQHLQENMIENLLNRSLSNTRRLKVLHIIFLGQRISLLLGDWVDNRLLRHAQIDLIAHQNLERRVALLRLFDPVFHPFECVPLTRCGLSLGFSLPSNM